MSHLRLSHYSLVKNRHTHLQFWLRLVSTKAEAHQTHWLSHVPTTAVPPQTANPNNRDLGKNYDILPWCHAEGEVSSITRRVPKVGRGMEDAATPEALPWAVLEHNAQDCARPKVYILHFFCIRNIGNARLIDGLQRKCGCVPAAHQ